VQWLANIRRRINSAINAHPIALIPTSIAYALLTIVCVFIAALLGRSTSRLFAWFQLPGLEGFHLTQLFSALYFSVLAGLLWLDYFRLTFHSFAVTSGLHLLLYPIVRVMQLVASTVYLFAVIHYYIALFFPNSYSGINIPISKATTTYDRLTTLPSLETFVNCIYFSVMTSATVGYGDIAPLTTLARAVTTMQVVISFVLVVVVLGWVIGNARSLTDPSPRSDAGP
jgi:hypothetical protein